MIVAPVPEKLHVVPSGSVMLVALAAAALPLTTFVMPSASRCCTVKAPWAFCCTVDNLHGRPQWLRRVEVAQKPLLRSTARVVHRLAFDGDAVAAADKSARGAVGQICLPEL